MDSLRKRIIRAIEDNHEFLPDTQARFILQEIEEWLDDLRNLPITEIKEKVKQERTDFKSETSNG